MNVSSRATWGLLLVGAALRVAAGESLLANGEFEQELAKAPPPGWVMWGDRKYKAPGNYTTDTANPHAGKGCFRVHKPANTQGYVVSDPARPVVVRAGKTYTVRLWARVADPAHKPVVYWDAYRTMKPAVEAPCPGRQPLDATREWREFTFAVTEGVDFAAAHVGFMLLALKAAMPGEAAQTLWVDDLEVTDTDAPPAAAGATLLDLADLARAVKLNHRVTPGETLRLTVNAAAPLGPVPPTVAGISFHRICGRGRGPYDMDGRYQLEDALRNSIAELRLPMTRFYGVGDEPVGLEGALDRIAALLKSVGIPAVQTVLELEPQAANVAYEPAVWARAATYAARKGYGFRHWEVANEPFTRKATAFRGPDEYATHVKAVAAAVRAAQPDARLGIAVNASNPSWCHGVLRDAAGAYDFVVAHHYAGAAGEPTVEQLVLASNYAALRNVAALNELIRRCNPGREVRQRDTEWGLALGGSATLTNRSANLCGALHRAVRLIYYAREGLVEGASSWEMFARVKEATYMVLTRDAPAQRTPIYWVYYYFTRHVGAQLLPVGGTSPWYAPAAPADAANAGPLCPALATLSADGATLYLVLVNGAAAQAFPATVRLDGFAARTAAGVQLTSADLDGPPLLKRTEDLVAPLAVTLAAGELRFQLPAHAVVFVAIQR